MGSRSTKPEQFDPYFGPYDDPYYQGPPGYPPYGPGYPPYGPYEDIDPYGYGGGYTSFENYGPPPYGGRGSNPMGGMSPWNYGNYYMGNTTMQMMPFMQRKVAKFAQRQAMGSMMGGFGSLPMMPAMPMMPIMPCLPAPCSFPVAAPMMAAATPLPMAFNPLVQNMYPMAPVNYQFPSNVGMVMNMPYGLPNPLLTPSTFGGFSPQWTGSGLSCCCCFCMPSSCPPPVCYYPRPVSVPQPVPVPCPVPVPIPNIQQVPVPRPVTVVAPPIVAGSGCPIPTGAPLAASQGGLIQSGFGQQSVMRSNGTSTTDTLFKSSSFEKPADKDRRTRAQKLAASLSNLGLNDTIPRKASKRHHHHHRHSKPSSRSDTSKKQHKKSSKHN